MRILNIDSMSILVEVSDAVKSQMRTKFKKENDLLTDQQIDYYLNNWDKYSSSFPNDKKDITRLTFSEVERLIDDAVTKSMLKGKLKPKTFNKDDDIIYNKDNLVILRGDLKEKCIQYGQNYSWCISRKDASNMFYTYRMRANSPMFYFVFDKDKPQHDVWHAIVVYVDRNSRSMRLDGKYDFNVHVATADNPGDKFMSWRELTMFQPKLKGLETLFKHAPLSDEEREDYLKYGKTVDLGTYEDYSLKEKYKYIKFGHRLNSDAQDITPKELIGVYAKLNSTFITFKTWNRLSNTDKKAVIKNVFEAAVHHDFIMNIGVPWKDLDIPQDLKDEGYHNTIMVDYIKKYPDDYQYILDDPELCLEYAKMMEEPFPEGEPAIATRSRTSYAYATKILQGRFELGEKAIAENAEYSIAYARDILEGRFELGEEEILKKNYMAFKYAYEIKQRIPEIEEKLIKTKDYRFIVKYADMVIEGPWPEAEPIIAENGRASLNYALDVLKKPFPEGEKEIKKHENLYKIYRQHL